VPDTMNCRTRHFEQRRQVRNPGGAIRIGRTGRSVHALVCGRHWSAWPSGASWIVWQRSMRSTPRRVPAFGDDDAYVVAELPDAVAPAALSLQVGASGALGSHRRVAVAGGRG